MTPRKQKSRCYCVALRASKCRSGRSGKGHIVREPVTGFTGGPRCPELPSWHRVKRIEGVCQSLTELSLWPVVMCMDTHRGKAKV